ncbi:MAG: cyclopropane-fatty-acyl-phospholipid synthase [Puia sp.]|nr:cyclopropane-fatty-acyl-phospholipid synthase [Puia sp.]
MWYDSLLEKDRIPDIFIRAGIRRLLRQRLQEEKKENTELQQAHLMQLIEELKNSPIALNTSEANEQHYEVPAGFYRYCLGRNLKYSSGYWRRETDNLDEAEEAMLALTCDRAGLQDGQAVLELGCGWGSLSLFMAMRYPRSAFTVVSNSHSQKRYIDGAAAERRITNLTVVTADMNSFGTEQKFDRVVSVEMFEHMRNYQRLMSKVSAFLKADGKLFVHIFTHRDYAYKFEAKDDSDWMSRYFFTGGIMPSDHLLLYFKEDMNIEQHWHVNGLHYSRTAEAWLRNMDGRRKDILQLFEEVYGRSHALKWWVYWRIFFMSCSELWKYNRGEEWMVSHYLFVRR